jgi:hypothetical protein
MILLIIGFCLGWFAAYMALDWVAEYERKLDEELRHIDESQRGEDA